MLYGKSGWSVTPWCRSPGQRYWNSHVIVLSDELVFSISSVNRNGLNTQPCGAPVLMEEIVLEIIKSGVDVEVIQILVQLNILMCHIEKKNVGKNTFLSWFLCTCVVFCKSYFLSLFYISVEKSNTCNSSTVCVCGVFVWITQSLFHNVCMTQNTVC